MTTERKFCLVWASHLLCLQILHDGVLSVEVSWRPAFFWSLRNDEDPLASVQVLTEIRSVQSSKQGWEPLEDHCVYSELTTSQAGTIQEHICFPVSPPEKLGFLSAGVSTQPGIPDSYFRCVANSQLSLIGRLYYMEMSGEPSKFSETRFCGPGGREYLPPMCLRTGGTAPRCLGSLRSPLPAEEFHSGKG